jgi:hypothetical protein
MAAKMHSVIPGGKMIDSHFETVRVTRRSFSLSKKNTIIAALAVFVVVIALGVMLATRSRALYPVMSGGKYGYIDKSAKVAIPPQFDRAGLFAEGMAAVAVGNRWGYIDRSGKLAIPPQFDLADPFSQGVALVGIGPKLGYIDKNGKFIINPRYDGAGQFGNGLAPVLVNGTGATSTRTKK